MCHFDPFLFRICHFHPIPFSVSPTCRFHLLVDFTYLGMPLGMLLCPSLGKFLGSYVLNRVLTIRLVQRLKGILHQRIKKERPTCRFHVLVLVLCYDQRCLCSPTLHFTYRFLSPQKLFSTFLWEHKHQRHLWTKKVETSTTNFHPPILLDLGRTLTL